jgi:hypothetical protein
MFPPAIASSLSPPTPVGAQRRPAAKRSLEPPMGWVGTLHGDPLARSMTGALSPWRGPGGSAGLEAASNLPSVGRHKWVGLAQRKTFDHPIGWSAFALRSGGSVHPVVGPHPAPPSASPFPCFNPSVPVVGPTQRFQHLDHNFAPPIHQNGLISRRRYTIFAPPIHLGWPQFYKQSPICCAQSL